MTAEPIWLQREALALRDDLKLLLNQVLPLVKHKTSFCKKLLLNEEKITLDLNNNHVELLQDNLLIAEDLIAEIDLLDFKISQLKSNFSEIAGTSCSEFESILQDQNFSVAREINHEIELHGKLMEEIFLLRERNNDTIQGALDNMEMELDDINRTRKMKNFISDYGCSLDRHR